MSTTPGSAWDGDLDGGGSPGPPPLAFPGAEKVPDALSVTELTHRIKDSLEGEFHGLWVTGEISRLTRAGSGHVYLSLKDAGAEVRAVIWRSTAARIRFDLEQGMEVLAFGDITVYPPRGEYQLKIVKVEPKGVGALQLAFQQLVERLRKEGLFDEDRKRPLPYLPRRIGIVTSPTGAAIRDMLKVLGRRFPNVHVTIHPVRVQGDGAAAEIAAAIDDFGERGGIDVMIIGRGGGSPEDLWAFNEEVVARAIARSEIPIISAVGHEIDVTIADYVADVRAATPSAAAEIVLPEEAALRESLRSAALRLAAGVRNRARVARETLRQIERSHAFRMPKERIRQWQQTLDDRAETLRRSLEGLVRLWRERLASGAAQLEAFSPLGVLGRGYSITMPAGGGPPVRDAAALSAGDAIETRLARGRVRSEVREILPEDGEKGEEGPL